MTNPNVVVTDARSEIIAVAVAGSSLPPAIPGTYITFSKRKLVQTLDMSSENRINAWVDSLRASSPTHAKSLALQDSQKTWPQQQQQPSALDMFDEITNSSKGKQIVMFLDYDGTLSPIVDDPDRAFMSEGMRETVRKLARYFPSAIVSGRCRDKVYSFVRLEELYYAGSHGMDIQGPSKVFKYDKKVSEAVPFQPASEYLPIIDQVYNSLREAVKSTPGALVENNKFCVSVHFRCVDEKKWIELTKQVASVLEGYPCLRVTHGRKVLEIRPTIKWDKGKALEFLLQSLGYGNDADVFPIYIGDDRTDEDAFKVLRRRGCGSGILVSKTPKDTYASYSLQEPAEVMAFLRRLVEWRRLSLRRQYRLRRRVQEIKVTLEPELGAQ